MSTWPSDPVIYEINTWVWLDELNDTGLAPRRAWTRPWSGRWGLTARTRTPPRMDATLRRVTA